MLALLQCHSRLTVVELDRGVGGIDSADRSDHLVRF
jgi:hypothetical protein